MAWNKQIKAEARRNRFKAWLILSLAVFLSLSLYSYNPQDSSLNSFGFSLKVTNYCGYVGASLADILYQLFGLSAWFFVFAALWLSYRFFTNRRREPLLSSFLLFGLLLFCFAGLGALHFPTLHLLAQKISLGGALGTTVTATLTPLFHTVGTAVLLWAGFLSAFVFYGPGLLSGSVLFSVQKRVLFLVRFFQKAPRRHIWPAVLKAKNILSAFFGFTGLFLKKRFLLLRAFLFKWKNRSNKKPIFAKHTSNIKPEKKVLSGLSPSTNKPEPNGTHFVFKKEESEGKNKHSAIQNPPSSPHAKNQQRNPETDLMETFVQARAHPAFSSQTDKQKASLKEPVNGKAEAQMTKRGLASLVDGKAMPQTIKQESASLEKEKPFFALPSLDILSDNPLAPKKISRHDVEDLSKKLLDKLSQFSIKGEIKAVKTGPAVILFEFKPEENIKVSRIREMESDLSLALSSESVRIIAPIPGRDVVGIEASRPHREMVYLKNLLKSDSFFQASLPLTLGRRADNVIGIRDLARIPHLLIAGTTGSGKSMFVVSFIISLLFRHTPETLRLLLIDPKQVDLSAFKNIPHLLSPIVTSGNETLKALNWALVEMEKRYRSLSLFGARDHRSFNKIIQNLSHRDKKQHEEANALCSEVESYYFEPLPLICIVIEEFGDLMADRNIRRSVENHVVRLAQKARAGGIHLVLAMQSPRKDVVTGLIKTNIPGRISFKVASGTDSRVILDEIGAERLLSHGDMLFLEPGDPKPRRYHGPFVRERDVKETVSYWQSMGEPLYAKGLIGGKEKNTPLEALNGGALDIKKDPMYNEIVAFVKTCDVVSASFLQRKFRIGYPRAARMIEVLFEEGAVGPAQGSKPREVLLSK